MPALLRRHWIPQKLAGSCALFTFRLSLPRLLVLLVALRYFLFNFHSLAFPFSLRTSDLPDRSLSHHILAGT